MHSLYGISFSSLLISSDIWVVNTSLFLESFCSSCLTHLWPIKKQSNFNVVFHWVRNMAQCYRWYCMFCLGQTGFFPTSRLQDLAPFMRLRGAPVKETNHPARSAFHWFLLVTASATRSRYRYILCPLISLRQNST